MKELKPFILQDALTGKAVKLRNGEKAFVRHREMELVTRVDNELFGYTSGGVIITWSAIGHHIGGLHSPLDIIGMYPETKIINGFEVPAPESTEPTFDTDIYLPSPIAKQFYTNDIWYDNAVDKFRLERGLIFLCKEDAIAAAKAMLGIDPYRKPHTTNAGNQIHFK